MATNFFAEPDFLDLLQFWDASRGGRALPDWSGDLGVFPSNLLPNLVVWNRVEVPTYLYVGAQLVRAWGSDPTGRPIFAEILKGGHADYIRSLGEETAARRAPIFSAAVYQLGAATMMMTGRLFTPFTYRGSAEPIAMVTVPLIQGTFATLQTLPQVGISGVIHEIRRTMIAMVPELCTRLEGARRYYQLSRHTHQRTLAQHIDAIARDLAGSALVPLPCLDFGT
jgi:hypothetical protein